MKKKLSLKDLGSLKAVEVVEEKEKPSTKDVELIEGLEAWVAQWQPSLKAEIVEETEASEEYPYGQFCLRSHYTKVIRKGILERKSKNLTTHNYWVVRIGLDNEYAYPAQPNGISGLTRCFLSQQEAEEFLGSLPDVQDEWKENEAPRDRDYKSHNYGVGNTWGDKGYW